MSCGDRFDLLRIRIFVGQADSPSLDELDSRTACGQMASTSTFFWRRGSGVLLGPARGVSRRTREPPHLTDPRARTRTTATRICCARGSTAPLRERTRVVCTEIQRADNAPPRRGVRCHGVAWANSQGFAMRPMRSRWLTLAQLVRRRHGVCRAEVARVASSRAPDQVRSRLLTVRARPVPARLQRALRCAGRW